MTEPATAVQTAPGYTGPAQPSRASLILRWSIVLGTVVGILLLPVPQGITTQSWRLLAIFAATIVGSIVRPAPAGAMVFFGVTAIALTGTMTPVDALRGYADPIVWMVLCAFFIARGVLKTGLGRRIAYLFIRALGSNSLGLAYALGFSDTVLASVVPSNGARAGGVLFPVVRSLAEAYESRPGPSARRHGADRMVSV